MSNDCRLNGEKEEMSKSKEYWVYAVCCIRESRYGPDLLILIIIILFFLGQMKVEA